MMKLRPLHLLFCGLALWFSGCLLSPVEDLPSGRGPVSEASSGGSTTGTGGSGVDNGSGGRFGAGEGQGGEGLGAADGLGGAAGEPLK